MLHKHAMEPFVQLASAFAGDNPFVDGACTRRVKDRCGGGCYALNPEARFHILPWAIQLGGFHLGGSEEHH